MPARVCRPGPKRSDAPAARRNPDFDGKKKIASILNGRWMRRRLLLSFFSSLHSLGGRRSWREARASHPRRILLFSRRHVRFLPAVPADELHSALCRDVRCIRNRLSVLTVVSHRARIAAKAANVGAPEQGTTLAGDGGRGSDARNTASRSLHRADSRNRRSGPGHAAPADSDTRRDGKTCQRVGGQENRRNSPSLQSRRTQPPLDSGFHRRASATAVYAPRRQRTVVTPLRAGGVRKECDCWRWLSRPHFRSRVPVRDVRDSQRRAAPF